MADTETLESVQREREVVREELNRVKAKQARVRENNDRQRRQLEVINARENVALRALMGQCDNCERAAHVVIYQTRAKAFLRMCYEHGDNHWQHRLEHKAAAPSPEVEQ